MKFTRTNLKQVSRFVMLLLLALPPGGHAAVGADAAVARMPRVSDYTLLWWAEGPPQIMGSKRASANGTLCFQSGGWGLAFDTKQVRALRAGEWPEPMGMDKAVQPGRPTLADLPAVDWDCAVVVAGHRFPCVGHMEPKDAFFQPVQLVESGHFFQRVVIAELQFADRSGRAFPGGGSLEISAWPDRLAMRLELKTDALPTGGQVELRLGDHRDFAVLTTNTTVQIEVFGDQASPRPHLEADPALKVGFDQALGCQTLQLPEKPWSNAKGTYYPEEQLDRLDRWHFTMRNDSDRPTVARLMFIQEKNLPITGFTPMLCETDGTPTGLPVQISKDWHQRPKSGVVPHQGPWFHGCAFMRLPPYAKRELVFQMAYARYGGVFAASLAQLSLIGWGHNQFWDQTAIGSFGESICFEPGRVQRRCFIDDVRPLLTLPQGQPANPWGWAQNCGGGDFLMWQDAPGSYQPMRATRTDYRAYGPCLTDASYAEESVGGELAARMDVSVPRSQDYLRTFFHLRYDVRRSLQWRRLAFFQLGADFYNETPARRVALGDANGLHEEWEPKGGKEVYDRSAVPMTGTQPWVSIHGVDFPALGKGQAAASRGFIVRSWRAMLGGQPVPQPHASFFCNKRSNAGDRTVVELAPPPGIKELLPGDFVEADLELVVFPAGAAAYYGPDQEFKEALAKEADTWQLVQREALGNALKCNARCGSVLNPYPLRVSVDGGQMAEVSVQGGIGYVPVTFTGLTTPDGHGVMVDGERADQSIHGNDYWQTDYDPATQRWQQTYNLQLSANRTHRINFTRAISKNIK